MKKPKSKKLRFCSFCKKLISKKTQTATEYMIILAVVIVIAVVISSILGDFPGIGSGNNKKIEDYKLTTSKVAVDGYGSFEAEGYSLIKIRNNHFDTLVANKIYVNRVLCEDQNITLNTGQSTVVNCSVVVSDTPNVEIIWTEITTDASYTETSGPTLPEDTSAPKVLQVSPENKASIEEIYPITFNCSTTDNMGLSKIELFIYNQTGSVINTRSSLISGTEISEEWVIDPNEADYPDEGSYTWNCKSTDFAGNIAWSKNFSLEVTPEVIPY